jgi:hypothetical protein
MATKSSGKKGGGKATEDSSRQTAGGPVVPGDRPDPVRVPGSPIIITGGSLTIDIADDPGKDAYVIDPTPAGKSKSFIHSNPGATLTKVRFFDNRTVPPSEIDSFDVPSYLDGKCLIRIEYDLP